MGSLADGLPSRFPIGTRYVVEGRGGEEGRLRIRLRYLEFPDGRHLELPADQANRARARRRRQKGPGSIAGWVRGWGLGGTPPGAMHSTLGLPRGSYA